MRDSRLQRAEWNSSRGGDSGGLRGYGEILRRQAGGCLLPALQFGGGFLLLDPLCFLGGLPVPEL
jgi:hypothetical protein